MPIAKIENDTVVQIDKTENDAPDGWEKVDNAVVAGMIRDGAGFAAPKLTEQEISEKWSARISERADTELQRGVSVTINGTTYGIRTGPQALALIDGAAIRADVSKRNGQSVTRLVPTDQGFIEFSGDALWQIFETVEDRQQGISKRARELQGMVEAGTISEDELESGWP